MERELEKRNLFQSVWITGSETDFSAVIAYALNRIGIKNVSITGAYKSDLFEEDLNQDFLKFSSYNSEDCRKYFNQYNPSLIFHIEPQYLLNSENIISQETVNNCLKSIINIIKNAEENENETVLCIPFYVDKSCVVGSSTLFQNPFRFLIDIISAYSRSLPDNIRIFPCIYDIDFITKYGKINILKKASHDTAAKEFLIEAISDLIKKNIYYLLTSKKSNFFIIRQSEFYKNINDLIIEKNIFQVNKARPIDLYKMFN
jgi:hypothetical protein